MAPITTPKPGHVPRVRRAALWFNHIWPGSLTEENNLVWRTHGPLGRGRWRWQTTFVRAWMLAGMFPAGSTPGHFGGVCRRRVLDLRGGCGATEWLQASPSLARAAVGKFLGSAGILDLHAG